MADCLKPVPIATQLSIYGVKIEQNRLFNGLRILFEGSKVLEKNSDSSLIFREARPDQECLPSVSSTSSNASLSILNLAWLLHITHLYLNAFKGVLSSIPIALG